VPNWSAISNGATGYTRDNTAPDAVTDLLASTGAGAGEINLTWTTTGDNGSIGNIIGGTFRIFYSSIAANMNGLGAGTSPSGTLARVDIATNATAGSAQGYTLGSLQTDGTTYYARLFISDEGEQWSDISNGATSYTRDTTAPGAITSFVAQTGSSGGEINLAWTTPGDDGSIHQLNNGTYRIYYSSVDADMAGVAFNTTPTTTLNRVDVATTGVNPGTTRYYTLNGLALDDRSYYVRIFTADEVPNWSAISNAATAYTLDVTSPAAVTDFAAVTGVGPGELDVSWTVVGDDGLENVLPGPSVMRIFHSTVSTDMNVLLLRQTRPQHWVVQVASEVD
jgi:hypothetical protein